MKNKKDILAFLEREGLVVEHRICEDADIKGITFDSKEVDKDHLFFCKGVAFKEIYLDEALKRGASLYISENRYEKSSDFILVSDVRRAMVLLAAFYYDYPDKKLKTIGVTGTKGKSTTVILIKSILDAYLEKKNMKACGLISTIYNYVGDTDLKSSNSTPEALILYKLLHTAVENGLEYMVIECSSQALKYDRVNEVEFDMAVFLNIGEDHVSPGEHPSFEDYFSSKLRIFDHARYALINKSTDHLEEVLSKIEELNLPFESFSASEEADYMALDHYYDKGLLKFRASHADMKEEFSLKLLGAYNVENALATMAVGQHFGLDLASIRQGLKKTEIKEREEILTTPDGKITAVVSYAHNGLSFEKSYEFIKEAFPDHFISSFFGIGGEKADNRMVGMCQQAVKNSDFIYIVPDDPGYKTFEENMERMLPYIEGKGVPYLGIDSRQEAIEEEFSKAFKRDKKTVLFIAGKGPEAYQKIMGKYIPIPTDAEVVKGILEKYDK